MQQGIRVSELISLKLEDVNMQIGYITCHDSSKDRMIPFGKRGRNRRCVLTWTRQEVLILKGRACEWLLYQLQWPAYEPSGPLEADQILWGKSGDQRGYYASYSAPFFAAHLIGDGADIHAVQAMLGHGDTGASQMYAVYAAATAARSDS